MHILQAARERIIAFRLLNHFSGADGSEDAAHFSNLVFKYQMRFKNLKCLKKETKLIDMTQITSLRLPYIKKVQSAAISFNFAVRRHSASCGFYVRRIRTEFNGQDIAEVGDSLVKKLNRSGIHEGVVKRSKTPVDHTFGAAAKPMLLDEARARIRRPD